MAITDGQVASADEVMNSFGSVFNDVAQNLFAADYNGFDSRLHNTGTPNLYNTYYSTFKTNNADDYVGLIYDSTNDLYSTPDYSNDFYLIIEATSASTTAINWSSNNTQVSGATNSGKWLITSSSSNYEVQRAEVYQSLFYGTDGTDPLASEFTSVTAIKSSESRDIGKKGYLLTVKVYPPTKPYGASLRTTLSVTTVTLSDTTNNTDLSSWSRLKNNITIGSGSSYGPSSVQFLSWEVPAGTTRNNIPSSQLNVNRDYNEFGTDLSADEYDNPSTLEMNGTGGTDGQEDLQSSENWAIFLAQGTVSQSTTYTVSNSDSSQSTSDSDTLTNYSLPAITQASSSDLNTSYLIMKETTASAVTNAIPIYNTIIDSANSVQISVSSNGGSNWVNVDNAEIARLSTSSTALWWKATITRTDTSTNDKITETAIKYNFW